MLQPTLPRLLHDSRVESLPCHYVSLSKSKNHSYTDGKKLMILSPPSLSDDFNISFVDVHMLRNGFRGGVIDFHDDDEKSATSWRNIPVFVDPNSDGFMSTSDVAKLYDFILEGSGLVERMKGKGKKTHITRKFSSLLLQSMHGMDPAEVDKHLGHARPDGGGGGSANKWSDNAQHYGSHVTPQAAKAISGFKPGTPYFNEDFALFLDIVISNHQDLVHKLADFICGKKFDWASFPDRAEIDKMNQKAPDFTKSNTKHLILVSSLLYVVRLPRLLAEQPGHFIFHLEGSPIKEKEFTDYLSLAKSLVEATETAEESAAAANAGPWAAEVSKKLASVREIVSSLPSTETSEAISHQQSQNVADRLSSTILGDIGKLMADLLVANGAAGAPTSPNSKASMLNEIVVETVRAKAAGTQVPPLSTPLAGNIGGPAAAAEPVTFVYANCKSEPGSVERVKRGGESYDPKQYIHVPYGGQLPHISKFTSMVALYDFWMKRNLIRPSYHDLEDNKAPWRSRCGNGVQVFVSRINWVMDLLEAITSRALSTHFTEALSINARAAAALLDEERTAGHHPDKKGATLLVFIRWLETLDAAHPGHATAATAFAKLEVKRIRDAAKDRRKQEEAATKTAKTKRKAVVTAEGLQKKAKQLGEAAAAAAAAAKAATAAAAAAAVVAP